MEPDNTTDQRSLTFGEQAVGLTFNHGEGEIHDHIQTIKAECATAIDTLNNLRSNTGDAEQKRMYSVAITELQTAQMWGVKAVTWGGTN